MTSLHVRTRMSGPAVLFADRYDAGRQLVDYIRPQADPEAVVFGLPRGGLPVGRPLAQALGCELRPVLVRKLPIPSDPEMGFGAVTMNGMVRLNEPVVRAFGITAAEVDETVSQVRAEVARRAEVYPGGWPLPPLAGRAVWLADDGLATGLSMLAAMDMLLAGSPASLDVCVPCSPADSLERLGDLADDIWCLAVQEAAPFAVASFYADFHDLHDDEVLPALAEQKEPR